MKSGNTIRVVVLAIAAFVAGAGLAQSLGDAAHESREQKDGQPHATKTYVNDGERGDIWMEKTSAQSASEDSQKKEPADEPTHDDAAQNVSSPSPKAPQQAAQASDGAPPAAAKRGVLLPGARKNKRKENAAAAAGAKEESKEGLEDSAKPAASPMSDKDAVAPEGEDIDIMIQPPQIATAQQRRAKKQDNDERDPALPPPLTANATITAGFYEVDTKNGHSAREASPVGSANLDVNGYFHHPGFLKFNFKPQGSMGKQSSEAVFPDGRGLSASTTFLGGSVAPFTVSYSKLDRKLVTFGPLDRLAGLDAKTSQDALNLNWRIRLRRLPELTMNFSRYNDTYEPLENLAPKTDNHARLFTLGAQEKVAGWNLQSDLRVERAHQKLINLFDPTQAPYEYGRNDREIRGSADRDFGHLLMVNLSGGASDGKSQINDVPYDQSFKFVNGSGLLRPSDRFSIAFRGGVTSNMVGVTLANALNNTTSGGTPVQTATLVPTQAHLTLQTYGAQATYSLTKDFRVDGDVSREMTSTPTTNSLLSPNSTLNSVQAGVGYSHHFSWVKFQSRYAANAGTFEYGTVGLSHSLGHRANAEMTFGSLHSLELTIAAQGSLQDLNGPTSMHDQTWGGSGSVSRMFFGDWKVQASANMDKNAYHYAVANYNTLGKGGNVSVSNSKFDLSAMYQLRDGLTVQADPRLQFLPAAQIVTLQGAFPNALIVPTASSFTSASVSVHPVGKFTARATWLTSRQRVDSAAHNHYNQWETSAEYQFRSLKFDFGYIHHDQDFGVDFFRRNRVYFRVVRQFKVL